jgi:hypothetical protein
MRCLPLQNGMCAAHNAAQCKGKPVWINIS